MFYLIVADTINKDMLINLKAREEMSPVSLQGERRSKPRVDCAYPAIVRGKARDQKKFQEAGRVQNLSVSGLYIRLKQSVDIGRELLIAMWFTPAREVSQSPTVVMRGRVVRADLLADGSFGLALKLEHHRFL